MQAAEKVNGADDLAKDVATWPDRRRRRNVAAARATAIQNVCRLSFWPWFNRRGVGVAGTKVCVSRRNAIDFAVEKRRPSGQRMWPRVLIVAAEGYGDPDCPDVRMVRGGRNCKPYE